MILLKEFIKINVIFNNNESAKDLAAAISEINNKFAKVTAIEVSKTDNEFAKVSAVVVS